MKKREQERVKEMEKEGRGVRDRERGRKGWEKGRKNWNMQLEFERKKKKEGKKKE